MKLTVTFVIAALALQCCFQEVKTAPPEQSGNEADLEEQPQTADDHGATAEKPEEGGSSDREGATASSDGEGRGAEASFQSRGSRSYEFSFGATASDNTGEGVHSLNTATQEMSLSVQESQEDIEGMSALSCPNSWSGGGIYGSQILQEFSFGASDNTGQSVNSMSGATQESSLPQESQEGHEGTSALTCPYSWSSGGIYFSEPLQEFSFGASDNTGQSVNSMSGGTQESSLPQESQEGQEGTSTLTCPYSWSSGGIYFSEPLQVCTPDEVDEYGSLHAHAEESGDGSVLAQSNNEVGHIVCDNVQQAECDHHTDFDVHPPELAGSYYTVDIDLHPDQGVDTENLAFGVGETDEHTDVNLHADGNGHGSTLLQHHIEEALDTADGIVDQAGSDHHLDIDVHPPDQNLQAQLDSLDASQDIDLHENQDIAPDDSAFANEGEPDQYSVQTDQLHSDDIAHGLVSSSSSADSVAQADVSEQAQAEADVNSEVHTLVHADHGLDEEASVADSPQNTDDHQPLDLIPSFTAVLLFRARHSIFDWLIFLDEMSKKK